MKTRRADKEARVLGEVASPLRHAGPIAGVRYLEHLSAAHSRFVRHESWGQVLGRLPDAVGRMLATFASRDELVDQELVRALVPAGQSDKLPGQQVHGVFNELYRDLDYDNLVFQRLEKDLKALIDKYFREGLFHSHEEDLVRRIVNEKLRLTLRQDLIRFEEGYHICPDYIEKNLSAKRTYKTYCLKIQKNEGS